MAALAGFGAARIIAALGRDGSAAMSLQLAIVILTHVRPVGTRYAFNDTILTSIPDEAQALGDWLMSPETGARLEDAFFATDPQHQTLLSEAAMCCG